MNLPELVVAPWTLMVRGARDEDIGPLWLAFLPLLCVGWRLRSPGERRTLALILSVCACGFAVWLAFLAWSFDLQQDRLLYPVFPLLAVGAAAAFHGLGALVTPRFRVRWVAGGLVAVVVCLSAIAFMQAFVAQNPAQVVTGVQSKDEYLAERLGLYYLAMQALNELPSSSRVVFLWEPRSYYCDVVCEPDALLDRWWHLRRTIGSPQAIAAHWRAEGVSHVLVYEAGRQFRQADGYDPFSAEDWIDLSRLIEGELTLVKDLNGAYRLYTIPPQRP
jgi:hypothetical protein